VLTGNLIKHVKSCWGEEAWDAANNCKNADETWETVMKPIAKTGSITVVLNQLGEGKVTYSHQMHTKTETKYIILHHIEIHMLIFSCQG
jgi:hypothetical protein